MGARKTTKLENTKRRRYRPLKGIRRHMVLGFVMFATGLDGNGRSCVCEC
jgi:hypothetical protein